MLTLGYVIFDRKYLGGTMKKRKITEIMEDMDRLEKVEISDELADTLKEYFKDEIEKEKNHDLENKKVARGVSKSVRINNQEKIDHGQSSRI